MFFLGSATGNNTKERGINVFSPLSGGRVNHLLRRWILYFIKNGVDYTYMNFAMYMITIGCIVLFPPSIMMIDLFIPSMVQMDIYLCFASISEDDELAENAIAVTSCILAAILDLALLFIIALIWLRLTRGKSVK
ncbi:hypothetical protein RM843_000602 [Salmonella enterica]|nr:hypothetical protein [Salmonella enterica]EBG5096007.1 hypothetical protein [Salmonella enterica subsp. enterica serovar India]EDV5315444.1 hypothetical protein [Salmonella enterica subsp. enterica]EGM1787338.1 hypothetical protein [Salmonella enterica subsp. enterica]EGR9485767.1 hypothetical protein [Salmonella enterica subsp. enterica]